MYWLNGYILICNTNVPQSAHLLDRMYFEYFRANRYIMISATASHCSYIGGSSFHRMHNLYLVVNKTSRSPNMISLLVIIQDSQRQLLHYKANNVDIGTHTWWTHVHAMNIRLQTIHQHLIKAIWWMCDLNLNRAQSIHFMCFVINTLRPGQNGRRFADDTFKHIFLNENVRISIKI